MASPEASDDRLLNDVAVTSVTTETPLPVRVKGEEPATESRAESAEEGGGATAAVSALLRNIQSQQQQESEVQLCIEESSTMTPSDELHSTDSASFPSLSDVITDDVIMEDAITDDIITDDVITDDVTTAGGHSPEPPDLREEEMTETRTDSTEGAVAAVAPPSSSLATPSASSAPPPVSLATPSSSSLTLPPASVAPPSSSLTVTPAAVAPPSASVAPPPACSVAPPPSVAEAGSQEYYLVKWITWKDKRTPVITQSQNGPCPLLAIMNTLFLRWKAKLPAQTEVVTTEDLMTHLGECVLSASPREKSKGIELNFQQNMSDAMAVLPKLSTGLDVNVRFTGVSDFEYTPECIVFDLLDIPLYHGWLLDPQSPETVAAVGKLSYNQLVEKIIDCKHSADSSKVSEGLVAEQFLESTASQLSYHGLCELTTAAKEGEVSVFFRNNHFSTMIKHQRHLYLLVTDQGFLSEERLVWESLHNVEGDGNFCDSEFRLFHQQKDQTRPDQSQIDQDYLVAVSLQQQSGDPVPLSDLELARQLQQEEYQQQATAQSTTQVRGQSSQPNTSRRREKDSDCVVL